MFINQITRTESSVKGNFLILCQPEPLGGNLHSPPPGRNAPIRGIIRPVRMIQCGHFMVGDIRVGNYQEVVSGTYGSDGLSMLVPHAIYRHGLDLRPDIAQLFATSQGHNGPGHEELAMRAWALENSLRLSMNVDMQYDRTTLDEIPDLDNVKSWGLRFFMAANIDMAGISYVTMRCEWILDSFRAGRAAFVFGMSTVTCGNTKTDEKHRSIENLRVEKESIRVAKMRLRNYLNPALTRHGWKRLHKSGISTVELPVVGDPDWQEAWVAPNKWNAELLDY